MNSLQEKRDIIRARMKNYIQDTEETINILLETEKNIDKLELSFTGKLKRFEMKFTLSKFLRICQKTYKNAQSLMKDLDTMDDEELTYGIKTTEDMITEGREGVEMARMLMRTSYVKLDEQQGVRQ